MDKSYEYSINADRKSIKKKIIPNIKLKNFQVLTISCMI